MNKLPIPEYRSMRSHERANRQREKRRAARYEKRMTIDEAGTDLCSYADAEAQARKLEQRPGHPEHSLTRSKKLHVEPWKIEFMSKQTELQLNRFKIITAIQNSSGDVIGAIRELEPLQAPDDIKTVSSLASISR